jgi:hypothetical protein
MTEPNPAAAGPLTAERLVLAVLAAELRGDHQGSEFLVAAADAATLRVALLCACAGVARIGVGLRHDSKPDNGLAAKVARRILELEYESDE